MKKRALLQQLDAQLRREIDAAKRAALASHEAATHEEARPENDKDTRSIEAAYLAGAQAERARDLGRLLNAFAFLDLHDFAPGEPIAATALIEVEVDDKRASYFLAPQGGGLRAEVDGELIQVITPEAPLGRALLGKTEGDVVELRASGKLREYTIVAVR
ncbi:MAG: GreA/GreB family elongation factor [Byssovorax sp.]